MAVTVLETLDADDLDRWRKLVAKTDAWKSEGLALAPDLAEVYGDYLEYFALAQELLEKYGVEGAEAEEAKISPFTGQIYIGSED